MDNKLVSIIIITYNSSKYAIETLESIHNQTFQNIELIVTDDCSSDNTVGLCREWIERKRDRFVEVKLITSQRNTGLSPNIWRGIKASSGNWIKLLAGDDLLFPDATAEYVDFVTRNNCDICYAKLKLFGDEELVRNEEPTYEYYAAEVDRDIRYQKRTIRRRNFVPGPGLFFLRKLALLAEEPSNKYPFADEWPFTTRIISSGNKIYLLKKYLVLYRIHAGSLCRDEMGMNAKVFRDMRKYVFGECLCNLLKCGDLLYAWDLFLWYCYLSVGYRSGKKSIYFKSAKVLFFLSPARYYAHFKKTYEKLVKLHPSTTIK